MSMPAKLRLRFELYSKLRIHQYRVQQARARVSEWLKLIQNPYIAFSTGKDSTCVLHLVREQAPSVTAVYFDADCAFPESQAMLKRVINIILYQTEPLLETFKRFGSLEFGAAIERETMRTTVYKPIKKLIQEYGFDGVAYGLRAEESRGREMHAKTRGAVFQYKHNKLWACQPIHDWKYNDVWAYIMTRDLDYCAVYDKLWELSEEDQRLSYWAGETNRGRGRWAILKHYWPELFDRFAAEFPEVRAFS